MVRYCPLGLPLQPFLFGGQFPPILINIPVWDIFIGCASTASFIPLFRSQRHFSCYFKGQLISKGLFGVFKCTKKPTIFF